MELSAAQLLPAATVAGAVAAFYYTTQRAEARELAAERIPKRDDLRGGLRQRLARTRAVLGVILALHLLLTVPFALGAAQAFASVSVRGPIDVAGVAVVVVAGLALLHLWVIGGDLRAVLRQLRRVPRGGV